MMFSRQRQQWNFYRFNTRLATAGRARVPFNFFNSCLSCRVGIPVLPKKILKHRARTPPYILFSHRFCAIHMGVQNRTRGGWAPPWNRPCSGERASQISRMKNTMSNSYWITDKSISSPIFCFFLCWSWCKFALWTRLLCFKCWWPCLVL